MTQTNTCHRFVSPKKRRVEASPAKHDTRHEIFSHHRQKKTRRKLNGVSPDLAGNWTALHQPTPGASAYPNSPLHLCFFSPESVNEESRPHPKAKPSPNRLEISPSPFMHHHRFNSDNQRASTKQIESSSVPWSTKSTETPLENQRKQQEPPSKRENRTTRRRSRRDRFKRNHLFPETNPAKPNNGFPKAQPTKRKRWTDRASEKASSHLREERERSPDLLSSPFSTFY